MEGVLYRVRQIWNEYCTALGKDGRSTVRHVGGVLYGARQMWVEYCTALGKCGRSTVRRWANVE